jgi:hypothetical protein
MRIRAKSNRTSRHGGAAAEIMDGSLDHGPVGGPGPAAKEHCDGPCPAVWARRPV